MSNEASWFRGRMVAHRLGDGGSNPVSDNAFYLVSFACRIYKTERKGLEQVSSWQESKEWASGQAGRGSNPGRVLSFCSQHKAFDRSFCQKEKAYIQAALYQWKLP